MKTRDLKSLPPLLARLTLATAFLVSGSGKLRHPARDADYFESLGIPAAKAMVPLVAAIEVSCGSLLGTGLFTRAAAIPLMPIMAVAIATARRKEFHSFSELTAIPDFSFLILLSYLLAEGGGSFSADALMKRRQARVETLIQRAA